MKPDDHYTFFSLYVGAIVERFYCSFTYTLSRKPSTYVEMKSITLHCCVICVYIFSVDVLFLNLANIFSSLLTCRWRELYRTNGCNFTQWCIFNIYIWSRTGTRTGMEQFSTDYLCKCKTNIHSIRVVRFPSMFCFENKSSDRDSGVRLWNILKLFSMHKMHHSTEHVTKHDYTLRTQPFASKKLRWSHPNGDFWYLLLLHICLDVFFTLSLIFGVVCVTFVPKTLHLIHAPKWFRAYGWLS